MSEEDADESFAELREIVLDEDLPGLRDWLIRHADRIKDSEEFRAKYREIALKREAT